MLQLLTRKYHRAILYYVLTVRDAVRIRCSHPAGTYANAAITAPVPQTQDNSNLPSWPSSEELTPPMQYQQHTRPSTELERLLLHPDHFFGEEGKHCPHRRENRTDRNQEPVQHSLPHFDLLTKDLQMEKQRQDDTNREA